MQTVNSFSANLVSFSVAVVTARPLANLVNTLFSITVNGIAIFVCGVIVYLVCRLLFYTLSRYIRKIKEGSPGIDRVDKIAGIFLGFCKFFLTMCMIFVALHLLSAIPFVDRVADRIMKGSVVGDFIFRVIRTLIMPLVGNAISNLF